MLKIWNLFCIDSSDLFWEGSFLFFFVMFSVYWFIYGYKWIGWGLRVIKF